MRRRRGERAPIVYRLALWIVSFQLCRRQRAEWRAEWEAELWYVCQGTLPNRSSRWDLWQHRAITQFCMGAIEDVRCLGRLNRAPRVRASGSAVGCAASLAGVAAVCLATAQLLPGVQHATQLPFYAKAANTVAISPTRLADADTPPIRLSEVRGWQHRSQHLFSEFAFYQPVIKSVHITVHDSPELRIARGSSNLFEVLGVPVSFRQRSAARKDRAVLVLSESLWRSRFGASREIFGRSINVGLQTVCLGGVVPDEATPAPGRIDAWLLLPDRMAEVLPDSTRVFALGRAAAQIAGTAGERWHMSVAAETDHRSDYDCVSLSAHHGKTWPIFCFTVLLALLSLPATTSLPLGEYATRNVKHPWATGFRRWMFFGAKVALVLPAIYFGSMDIAYALPWSHPNTPQYLQLVTSFCGTLFALRWCLRDQRKRCPVCLGKLTCPVRVGQPSRNFLAFNGTELICSGGHGLLHVPELPTSWFGAPRWLHLDASWSGLFLRPV